MPLGKTSGTRVFKKSSPNGKITTYLGKRDFIDYGTHTDPVDGVVLVDTDYLKERKVFVNIVAAFRYGREDLDVLGLTFRKDLLVSTIQVYPPPPKKEGTEGSEGSSGVKGHGKLTRLQERLLKKLGQHAYPFYFEIPANAPASVTLQPAPDDTAKPCGVDYELKTYVADNEQEKAHKRNSVRLAIRKLTYAPTQPAPQPSAELIKDFMMSSGKLKLEASLDKEKYYHGERIAVNVTIDNGTSKTIKKIRITIFQVSDIILFSKASYKCPVEELDTEEGFPVQPSQTGFCKVYELCPTLDSNRDKRGLALDGKLKHEDTNLASSTIVADPTQKENLGIVVQYKVKVRLFVGMLMPSSEVAVELPFTLTHPKPESPRSSVADAQGDEGQAAAGGGDTAPSDTPTPEAGESLDTNLIQLEETLDHHADDDIIFEDFARLRLHGLDMEDTDA